MGKEDVINITIEKREDYEASFYRKYVDVSSALKAINGKYHFKIYYHNVKDIDEQLIFHFYLIVNKYYNVKYNDFSYDCYLSDSDAGDREFDNVYFKLGTYGYILNKHFKIRPKLLCGDKVRYFQLESLNNLKRMTPIFIINIKNECILKALVTQEIWDKIIGGKNLELNSFENIIYKLCWRHLFSEIGSGNKSLSHLRNEAFLSEDFKKLILGIPLLSLLIFSMFDAYYREDSIQAYKEKIQRQNGARRVTLNIEDFLYETQCKQKRLNFDMYNEMLKDDFDIKSIFNSYKEKKISSYIVKELYESITVSEGILQLIENVVFHAEENNKGTGLFSLYIQDCEKNLNQLRHKYPNYMGKNSNGHSKYYLEILISDLSGSSIPSVFYKNNKEFFAKNKEEIEKRMSKLANEKKEIPTEFTLKDFYSPEETEIFWNAFFSFSDKAVNHYGLPIFDSCIDSKNGLFEVQSGKEKYTSNDSKCESIESVHGTHYKIICPLSGLINIESNIYDSMYNYDYLANLNDEIFVSEIYIGKKFPNTSEEKVNYSRNIMEIMKKNERENVIFSFDISKLFLESTIRGLLWYIFETQTNEDILIAILNCKTYEILNIVRIISIYYDKQGKNNKMENVQIYIKGANIGDEILFRGGRLEDAKRFISKSTCMRGIMYDNFQTINKILNRKEKHHE